MDKLSLICLGLEGTAHSFGAGIVTSKGDILANEISTYLPITGGIHPREAAQHHSAVASQVLQSALLKAGIAGEELDVIAFSQGPGLGPCLRTTAVVARALSTLFDIPLVGVNHCLAHVEIGRLLTGTKDPITLYVSGGNTIVSAFADKRYRVFGETIDIPIGNALDMFGREAGLQHPGGPKVEVLARKGKKLVELPYIVKGMDLSFSGLVTAAIRKLKEEKEQLEDVCFSLQEYAFSMLVEVTERAIAHTQKKELLLTGGVAQNKRLQEMLGEVAKDQEVAFFTVPKEVAGDNGAMIAWTGILLYKYGKIIDVEKSLVDPKWRLEAVEIPWSME